MTLISKVTALKDTIDTQEKNYDALYIELEEKQIENAELKDSQEELQKHVDSLLAECAELRQVRTPTVKSDQLERMIQERRDQNTQDGIT